MSRRRPALLLSLAVLACAADRAIAAVVAPAPVVFRKLTKRAEVELRAPKALSAWPAFRESLVVGDTAKLNGFVRAAENGGPAAGAKTSRRNWRRISYTLAGSTPRLVSVIRRDDRDTGGAHAMPSISAVIWDQRTKTRLPVSALLRPDADPAPLDEALCDAIKAAKAERENAVPLDGKTWRCPLFSQVQAALAPSTTANKAGGLIALINPDEVGPYAEGLYQVVIPLEAIRDAIRRPYRPEFAGAPSAKAKALTDPAPTPPTRRAREG